MFLKIKEIVKETGKTLQKMLFLLIEDKWIIKGRKTIVNVTKIKKISKKHKCCWYLCSLFFIFQKQWKSLNHATNLYFMVQVLARLTVISRSPHMQRVAIIALKPE